MKFKGKLSLSMVMVLVFTLAFSSFAMAGTYTIESGDVLWKIAKDNGMDYDTLAKANGIEDPHMIMAGDVLNVNMVEKIDLLTTNDFHGKVEGGYEAGAAKLAAYMAHYKAMNPEGTLILDGGDSFQGTPMSNLLFGKPVVEMYNEIGYTATTVGNHEFDWGIEKVLNTMKESKAEYPMITANVYKDGKLAEWATPYIITEVKGVKVGIIGLSTLETEISAHADFVGDYTFEDPAAITKALIPVLEEKGAELVIVLGHLPAEQNDEGITGELAQLVSTVDGIDAAIGGHSHKQVSGKVNGTPVIMGYKHGRMIGHITMYYDTVADKVVASETELIEVRKGDLEVTENAKLAEMVEGFAKDLEPVFGEVVGTLTDDLVRDYNTTSPAGNWFADVMKTSVKADVGFTNAGGLRMDVPKGEVKMGGIYEIMPFDNVVVTTTMKGSDIKVILEQGATLFKGMIQISGLTFEYDSSKPEQERVTKVMMADGTELDMDKEYLVATNDFLAGGKDGFVTLKDFTWSDQYKDYAPLLRDALKEDLAKKGTYTPDTTLRAVDVAK